MVFYKNLDDLAENIQKISRDDHMRRKKTKIVKKKYMKYFNSTKVAEFIIDKGLDLKNKNKYFWHN